MIEGEPCRLSGDNFWLLVDQFLRFGVVGIIGFVVDTAVLYAGLYLGTGLYFGRIISYFCAANTTWALNRKYTFRVRGRLGMLSECLRFVVLNIFGALLNFGVYFLLVTYIAFCARYPILAVAAGSISGLSVNFTLSKLFVFQ